MTAKKQHIGSHNSSARPDQKMGGEIAKLWPMNSTANKAAKRQANAKRRRRDKETE